MRAYRLHQHKRQTGTSYLLWVPRLAFVMIVVGGCFLAFNRPASAALKTPTCSRGLTKPEMAQMEASGTHVQPTNASVPIGEQQAIQASQYNLVPDAPSHASALVCQLAAASNANLYPTSLNGASLGNRVVWIIMYKDLGPRPHNPSAANTPRDYYIFVDANTGAWLFGLSLDQPQAQ